MSCSHALRTLAIALGAAMVIGAGAGVARGDSVPSEQRPPQVDPIPGHVQQGPVRAQLEVRAFGFGLTAPLYGTFAPGPGPSPGVSTTQPDILYVVDQDGPLWAVDTETGAKRVFANTRVQRPLMPLGAFGPGTFDERGFLGVAFHPDYQVPLSPGFGKFYTVTSEEPGTNTDAPPPGVASDHMNVVVEWQAANPLARPPVHPPTADNPPDGQPHPDEVEQPFLATPLREVARIGWPQFNHNGGAIFFGTRPSDRRFLYYSTGDGGCADDQNNQIGFRLIPCGGHGTGSEATAVPNRFGNGQNPASPWGKLFRFDPLVTTVGVVPSGDNVTNPVLAAATFAFGLRNPWRASSDRFDLGGSGDVWLSDVGQNHLEEVDHVAEADLTRPTLCPTQGTTPQVLPNFGWHFKEGTWTFNPFFYVLLNPASDAFVMNDATCATTDIDPMAQYDHDEGTAVIGGFVYRGREDAGLAPIRGRYVFGDYSRRFLNGVGEVFLLREENNCNPNDCTPRVEWLTNGPLPGDTFMLGFGEDARGNIWALANETGIPFAETGLVMRLVSRCSENAALNGEPGSSSGTNTCRD